MLKSDDSWFIYIVEPLFRLRYYSDMTNSFLAQSLHVCEKNCFGLLNNQGSEMMLWMGLLWQTLCAIWAQFGSLNKQNYSALEPYHIPKWLIMTSTSSFSSLSHLFLSLLLIPSVKTSYHNTHVPYGHYFMGGMCIISVFWS